MSTPYIPGSQDHSCTYERSYPPQAEELIRRVKKLCHEQEETNRLLRFICYKLSQGPRECDGALGIDCNALLFGLEPQKRKRKKHTDTLGGWSL